MIVNNVVMTAHKQPFKMERHALAAVEAHPGYKVVPDEFGGFIGVQENPGEVQCPGCGICYFNLTSKYNSQIDANPAMLDLKQKYKDYGWSQLGKDPSQGYGCLECPDCGAALAPSGKLRVK